MTEKEVHKMRVQDLVQLLLAQGIEVVKLQEDLNKKHERLAILRDDNDVLKSKLDESDARIEDLKKGLDESDAYIRELEEEMASLQADRWIDLAETGSIVEAAQEITEIFQAAQREAERYLSGELQVQEEIQPARPASQPSPKRRKRTKKKPMLHTVDEQKASEDLEVTDHSINLEKEEANSLKSDGKTSDKEKEKLEEVKLQQLETSEKNAEGLEDASSQGHAAEAVSEPWPDEVPSAKGAEDSSFQEELWPDEVARADGTAKVEQQEDSDGGRQKGLFHNLRWGKNRRQKKEKAKKGLQ